MILIIAPSLLFSSSLAKKDFAQVILPNNSAITAELAVSEEQRARGLMFQEALNSDQGMLFIFEEEGKYSFWMMDMCIPLDILWLDENKRIVHVEQDVPPCKKIPCPSYVSPIPAMYVLELKAGSVKEHGLKMFDKLDFFLPLQHKSP
jgi:uncharacterized membrane protein (UPF0127 family)